MYESNAYARLGFGTLPVEKTADESRHQDFEGNSHSMSRVLQYTIPPTLEGFLFAGTIILCPESSQSLDNSLIYGIMANVVRLDGEKIAFSNLERRN